MTSLLKLGFCIALALVSATHANASVVLTTFGSSASPAFAIDGSTSFSTQTQSASSITIGGSDFGNSLVGTFNTVNITGNSSILTLTGSTTSAPASNFNVLLYDTNGKTATYTGGTWSGLSSGTTSLVFASALSGFDYTHVYGLELDTAGTGSTIGATLTGLTAGVVAAPEPSRAILAALGMGALLLRRRRR